MRGIITVLTFAAIAGALYLLQGLWFQLIDRHENFLGKWRWICGVPSVVYLLWFFLVYAK